MLRNEEQNQGSRGGGGRRGMIMIRGCKFQVIRWISSGHAMHSMVTIAYTTVLYIQKLLREEILKFSPHTQMITDGCVK